MAIEYGRTNKNEQRAYEIFLNTCVNEINNRLILDRKNNVLYSEYEDLKSELYLVL